MGLTPWESGINYKIMWLLLLVAWLFLTKMNSGKPECIHSGSRAIYLIRSWHITQTMSRMPVNLFAVCDIWASNKCDRPDDSLSNTLGDSHIFTVSFIERQKICCSISAISIQLLPRKFLIITFYILLSIILLNCIVYFVSFIFARIVYVIKIEARS